MKFKLVQQHTSAGNEQRIWVLFDKGVGLRIFGGENRDGALSGWNAVENGPNDSLIQFVFLESLCPEFHGLFTSSTLTLLRALFSTKISDLKWAIVAFV